MPYPLCAFKFCFQHNSECMYTVLALLVELRQIMKGVEELQFVFFFFFFFCLRESWFCILDFCLCLLFVASVRLCVVVLHLRVVSEKWLEV